MRINKSHPLYSFEDRCAHQSANGGIAPGKVKIGIAKLDSYAAKLARLTEETNRWLKMPTPPSPEYMADHARRCEAIQTKFKTLIAIPEINAALLKREAAAKRERVA
ncbi:MAG TPA: hypothetical protein VMV59_07050 [Candidatus Dormibacteraeota bacterium]|nr:hypothetical protein [Candidatus Dormibacteraeota bacterium]